MMLTSGLSVPLSPKAKATRKLCPPLAQLRLGAHHSATTERRTMPPSRSLREIAATGHRSLSVSRVPCLNPAGQTANKKWLKEGDVLEKAGYPKAKDPFPTVRVVRNGKVIATYWSDPSGSFSVTYCDRGLGHI